MAPQTVLDTFREAREERSRGPARWIVLAAVGAFAVVALASIVGNDRSPDVAPLTVSPSPGPVAAGTGGAPPAGAPTAGMAPPGSAAGVSSAGAPTGGGAAGSTSPSGATTPGATPAPRGGGTAGPGPPAEEPVNVAIVSPTLRMFAFGSRVGMPLLCSVAASGLFAQIPDPTLAQVATAVVTSCIDYGNQGAEALLAMNEQLAGLEALNPATAPIIDALAEAFNAAGSEDVPFATSLVAMGRLIAFFSAPTT